MTGPYLRWSNALTLTYALDSEIGPVIPRGARQGSAHDEQERRP